MKKKFASLFLVMALVLTMIPASAFAGTAPALDNSETYLELFTDASATETTDTYAYGDSVYIKANCAENDSEYWPWIGVFEGAWDLDTYKSGGDSVVYAYAEQTDGPQTNVYNGQNAVNITGSGNYVTYQGGFDGTFKADTTYTVILFKHYNDYLPLTYKQFTVGGETEEPVDPNLPTEASMTVNGTTFDREDEIIVTTYYATTDKDWVAIYPKGYSPSNGASLAWYYVKDKDVNVDIANKANVKDPHCLGYSVEDGRIRPGEYTIYLLENDGRDVITSADITVTGDDVTVPDGYSMTLVPDELLTTPNANIGDKYLHLVDEGFGNGLNIKVTAPEGADTSSMWVGIYDEGLPNIGSFNYTDVGAMAGTTEENSVLFDVSEAWSNTDKCGGKRKLVLYTDADSYIAAETIYFFVRPYLGENTIEFDNAELVYTGEQQTPVIKNNKIAGKDARHWTATFPEESIEVSDYTVKAKFHGEVGGSATGTYKIVARDVNDATVTVDAIADVTETGSQIKPVPVVKFNGKAMVEGTDYDVTYGENTKPGKGTITITGKGNYTGERVVEFNIIEKVCNHVWDEGVMTTPDTCTTAGVKTYTCTLDKTHTKTETVDVIKDHKWDAGKMTTADTCTAVGVKTYTCANDAKHTKTENVDVIKTHAFGEAVVTKAPTCTAGGQKVATCTYGCGEQQVTAIAKAAHTIVDVPAVEATCTATGLTAGKKCSVCGTWTLAQGTVDKVAHTVAASTVTKKATAKANGVITNTCACGEVVSTDVIAKPVVTLSKAGVVYTGKKVKAPVVRVKAGGKTVATANYTITKPKNVTKMKDIGRYVYTVKFKGEKYSGTVKVNFEIKPAKTKIKAPAAAKKAITVKWTKAAKKEKVTGYEVMYATNSKFTKGKKTVTVKGASKVSKKVTKLKSKTKYYVKVRSYKTVKGVKIYSDWSAVKSIKAK